MLVSLAWLREYVTIDLSAEELARRLTGAGLAVEGVADAPGGDTVLNVEVTSNRPDCLGHIGVAREIAALTGQTIRLPDVSFLEAGGPVADLVAGVRVEAPAACRQYLAAAAAGVRIAPSPMWMQRRLSAVGIEPISNVVDATNYVLMEVGQPLHAFDLDKLRGRQIVVRRARPGEAMTAIAKEKKLAFDPAALGLPADGLPLVIADAERPVAVAGVMGGKETEISDATRNVLLEAAEFDMLEVRRSSRRLDLTSDSAYRFERGVDPFAVEWAARRAMALILQTAGGSAAAGMIAVRAGLPARPEVTLRIARIPVVLGMAIPADEARRTLEALGFEILAADAAAVRVRVPGHRLADVTREIDLIEEVARVHGYGDLPDAEMPVTVAARSRTEVFRGRIADALHAAGYREVLAKTLVLPKLADLPAADGRPPAVLSVSPRQTAFHDLRRSLLPSLLELRRLNQNVGVEHAAIYEIAHVFRPAEGRALPDEPARLGMLIDGDGEDDWRRFQGALRAVFGACGLAEELRLAPAARPGLHPGLSLEVRLGDRAIGCAGRVGRETQKAFDLRRPVFLAEIDVDPLAEAGREGGRFRGLPRFPAVVRDLNVVVGADVLWRRIEEVVRSAGVAELESLEYRSTYTKGLPEGKKSVTFSMTFRRADDTLTGEQATAFQQRVLGRLKAELAAELRA
jgi:phenylalanyl-tRNA synthetase beta chain